METVYSGLLIMAGVVLLVISFIWSPSESKASNAFAWLLIATLASFLFSWGVSDLAQVSGPKGFLAISKICFPSTFALTLILSVAARCWKSAFAA